MLCKNTLSRRCHVLQRQLCYQHPDLNRALVLRHIQASGALVRQPCKSTAPAKSSPSPKPAVAAAQPAMAHISPFKAKMFQPQSPGFKLFRITGDGSCLFRAMVQGAQIAAKGTPMPAEQEGKAAHNLRLAVVHELRSKREEMEPFLAGIADDWEAYLRRMSDPWTWGGEPEMVMAANILRRPITVYRGVEGTVEPVVTYGEELGKGGVAAVHLLWSGVHYDLLLPAQPPQPASSTGSEDGNEDGSEDGSEDGNEDGCEGGGDASGSGASNAGPDSR